jgi:hypothetical protein
MMTNSGIEENSFVLTKERGLTKLKNVAVGDSVLSFDIMTKQDIFRKIIDAQQFSVATDQQMITKNENGSELFSTNDCLFLTFNHCGYQYIRANQLVNRNIVLQPSQKEIRSHIHNSDIGWFIGAHLGDGSADIITVMNKKAYGTYYYKKYRTRILGDNENVIKT